MCGTHQKFRNCSMGAITLALLLLVSLVQNGRAIAQPVETLGELRGGPREAIIGGQPPSTSQRCIEVEIGGDREFGCLNQLLKREVDRVNPAANVPPLDARSSDIRVGNVNVPAVRQQYGPNFERLVIPFRPPVPVLPRR
jgi:hypothetical protein